MKPLALFCKSYSSDLRRLIRLAESIRKFNVEKLPFYVSVPLEELKLFRDHLDGFDVELITDQDILRASPRIDVSQVSFMQGNLAQQVVKSEFWRMNLSMAYVCLDSDALFIRPFRVTDFITPNGIPYTMLDESHDLLVDALCMNHQRVVDDFKREADQVQQLFGRLGRRYSFGPFPLVWHRKVWESLDEYYLKPKGLSFADAIVQAPIESRWYGEALLAYKAVPLLPCQSFFKVYHYAWQLDQDRRRGIDESQLLHFYSGVIYQSSWERDMDWPSEVGGLSKIGRRIRRRLRRI